LPPAVLDRAEAYRDQDAAQLEELLARLEREEHEARELARRLDLERVETTRLRADLEGRERAVREAERTSESRAREEARQLLLDARAEVEEAIRALKGAAAGGQDLEEAGGAAEGGARGGTPSAAREGARRFPTRASAGPGRCRAHRLERLPRARGGGAG
jgi:DNA mismatch repair protein MutS2